MSCIVAEPMHSGMIGPVNISSNPVNSNAPRSFEFWTLKGTDVKVRFNEMIIHSSCIVTDLYWQGTFSFNIYGEKFKNTSMERQAPPVGVKTVEADCS